MFSAKLARTREKIGGIRSILRFRHFYLDFLPKEKEWAGEKVLSLMAVTPDIQHWKVYDHSACFNSLYNVYESFLHDVLWGVLEEYQRNLGYRDLPDCLRQAHIDGMRDVLGRIEQARYAHLDKNAVAGEQGICQINNDAYTITPELVFFHDQNIRVTLLDDLFRRLDFGSVSQFLNKDPVILELLEGSDHSGCEGQIGEFVSRRNDCSHGEVDEILSIGQLIFYCDFIEAACAAVARFASSETLKKHVGWGLLKKSGVVTEKYSDNISVAKVEFGDYSPGSDVVVEANSFFSKIEVENLRVNDQDVASCTIEGETELGLKTGLPLKVGNGIYVCVI